MDPEEQKEISRMGGRASHGGRSRSDSDEEEDDQDRGSSSNRRHSGRQGFASMDPDEQREIARMGGRASHGGRGSDYDESDYDEDDNGSSSSGNGRRHSGRQGFASMDRDEQREIARMGGRASHGGGRSRDYESDYDEDDNRNERSSSSSSGGRRHSGRQGFASMDPDEQREIARMGGRASHGGRGSDYEESDYDEDDNGGERSSSSSSSGGRRHSGRQGFASMDPDEQREIARMGGRASHGGGRGRREDTREDERDNRTRSRRH